MFKIAICDDESHFRKCIREILVDYLENKDSLYEIDEFESGKDFIEVGIGFSKYNIVFLDINMDEMDGMETAQRIREVTNEIFIVFVTAFANYAFEGYQVDATRYILKNNENLSELIAESMEAISEKMNYVVKKENFDFIEGKKTVSLDRLLYIESQLHKLEFYIIEDKLRKYTLYGKLDELEEKLRGNDFVRLHKSYLVNMKYIEKVRRYEVLLSNGIILGVPRARYKFLEETYAAYKGEM